MNMNLSGFFRIVYHSVFPKFRAMLRVSVPPCEKNGKGVINERKGKSEERKKKEGKGRDVYVLRGSF